jgi:hypothetical protein
MMVARAPNTRLGGIIICQQRRTLLPSLRARSAWRGGVGGGGSIGKLVDSGVRGALPNLLPAVFAEPPPPLIPPHRFAGEGKKIDVDTKSWIAPLALAMTGIPKNPLVTAS